MQRINIYLAFANVIGWYVRLIMHGNAISDCMKKLHLLGGGRTCIIDGEAF